MWISSLHCFVSPPLLYLFPSPASSVSLTPFPLSCPDTRHILYTLAVSEHFAQLSSESGFDPGLAVDVFLHVMLAHCMSTEELPHKSTHSARVHSCVLEDTRRDWVIGGAGVTCPSSPTHSRSAEECVMHRPFVTWIIKCNKGRVMQEQTHTHSNSGTGMDLIFLLSVSIA